MGQIRPRRVLYHTLGTCSVLQGHGTHTAAHGGLQRLRPVRISSSVNLRRVGSSSSSRIFEAVTPAPVLAAAPKDPLFFALTDDWFEGGGFPLPSVFSYWVILAGVKGSFPDSLCS